MSNKSATEKLGSIVFTAIIKHRMVIISHDAWTIPLDNVNITKNLFLVNDSFKIEEIGVFCLKLIFKIKFIWKN